MIELGPLARAFAGTPLQDWARGRKEYLRFLIEERWRGNWSKWQEALASLPDVQADSIDLNEAIVRMGSAPQLSDAERAALKDKLLLLHPWRKGPFSLFGLFIDCEWRSDLKWDRLKDQISSLEGRRVLDVGCGNGYHLWRMRGAGASQVLGIDPMLVYLCQFEVLQRYAQDSAVMLAPGLLEDLPERTGCFDTVFSMGVLYHQREPLLHLEQLKGALRPGGELVLETLVIDDAQGEILYPRERYAQMRNVWAIPSCSTLKSWLCKAGFQNVRCIDVTVTTSEEQRVTDWMNYQSLADFLDRNDARLTIEGYPAPRRALLIGRAPEA